jgi:hypothetical protein
LGYDVVLAPTVAISPQLDPSGERSIEKPLSLLLVSVHVRLICVAEAATAPRRLITRSRLEADFHYQP